jgi:hypothetical protein
LEETRYWNNVLSAKPFREFYMPFELKDKKLRNVVLNSGYVQRCINGINKFVLDPLVQKYRQYVKAF